jgi:hypothetical protein
MLANTATKTTGRAFQIEDDGDEFQVLMYLDGEQVASASVPDLDGSGLSFYLALDIAKHFMSDEGVWGLPHADQPWLIPGRPG